MIQTFKFRLEHKFGSPWKNRRRVTGSTAASVYAEHRRASGGSREGAAYALVSNRIHRLDDAHISKRRTLRKLPFNAGSTSSD
jgi:hypothetical protein